MVKVRCFIAVVAAASLFSVACAKRGATGEWKGLDTATPDAFFSVNFVNEDTGWLNGQTGRNYVPPEGSDNSNANANRAVKPKPGAKKAIICESGDQNGWLAGSRMTIHSDSCGRMSRRSGAIATSGDPPGGAGCRSRLRASDRSSCPPRSPPGPRRISPPHWRETEGHNGW